MSVSKGLGGWSSGGSDRNQQVGWSVDDGLLTSSTLRDSRAGVIEVSVEGEVTRDAEVLSKPVVVEFDGEDVGVGVSSNIGDNSLEFVGEGEFSLETDELLGDLESRESTRSQVSGGGHGDGESDRVTLEGVRRAGGEVNNVHIGDDIGTEVDDISGEVESLVFVGGIRRRSRSRRRGGLRASDGTRGGTSDGTSGRTSDGTRVGGRTSDRDGTRSSSSRRADKGRAVAGRVKVTSQDWVSSQGAGVEDEKSERVR